MASGRNRRWELGVVALGMLLGCFESSVGPTTSAGSSSDDGPPSGACIPGETQSCLCVGGQMGVQSCNAEGTGYSDCECVGESGATGGPTGGGSSTGPIDKDSADTGPADTGPVDTGPVDTGPADTGFPDLPGYESCKDDARCSEDAVCFSFGDAAACAQFCAADDECPISSDGSQGSCIDYDGDGLANCVLQCDNGPDQCPGGMICVKGFCLWPF